MMIIMAILCWTGSVTTMVDSDRIKKTVEDYIYDKFGSSHDDAIVEVRNFPSRISVQSSDYEIRVALGKVPRLKGYVSIPVEIVSKGRTERTIVVPVHIRTFANVVVTTKQYQKHEVFSADDAAIQRVETTTLSDDVIQTKKELEGRRGKRMISANAILYRSMVEKVPNVRQDNVVTLAVRSNKTMISAQGVAKQDGNIGDVITVQRAGSHERIQARIVDQRHVEIELDGKSQSRKE
jgi:flagella basal body P-ring formation protein FlgA